MKNKALLKLILLSVFVIVISAVLFVFTSSSAKTFEDIQKISAQDVFTQSDQNYLVYFWQEGCKYCIEVESDIVTYANDSSIPVYVVDMKKEANFHAWYDWESHHEKFDVVIGKITDGKEVYEDGIDLTDYTNDSEINWSIEETEDKKIIASHNTPYPNTAPNSTEELEIVGTPTMISVQNGAFDSYYFGVDEIRSLMTK